MSRYGGWYCPVSTTGGFDETSRCFLRWRQVSSNSSLLFSMFCWFSVKITSFSVRQRSQALLPLEKACPFLIINHFTLNWMFSSFFDLLIKTFYTQQKFVRQDLRLSTSQTGCALTDKVINYWAISLTVEKRGLRRRQLATLWQYQLRTENYFVTNAL